MEGFGKGFWENKDRDYGEWFGDGNLRKDKETSIISAGSNIFGYKDELGFG